LWLKNYATSWKSKYVLIHRNKKHIFFLVVDSSGSIIISKPKTTWTATLGLVVHAAADGIALGKHKQQ
jgi:hypothetical protein